MRINPDKCVACGNELFDCFDSIVMGGGADVFATICVDYINGRKKKLYLSFDAAPEFRYKRIRVPGEDTLDLDKVVDAAAKGNWRSRL